MTQATRQNNLFAAENWQAVYQSFSNADFKAYDFDTLRSAMVDYIRLAYPEDFNDWIQSSEFLALIDLIAFLGQNLSFRIDLNSRENFIDTAEKRESVLRMARFLSYNPSRNIAASGLLKIKAIKTTETMYDSSGQDLSNKLIQWVNVSDPDNYEKFVTILNSALSVDHKFGNPLNSGSVDGILTQQYALESVPGDLVTVRYSANVNGIDESFEICNSGFVDTKYFNEVTPDPYQPFKIIYRNDNAGSTSTDTGFFVLFKQGQLIKNDYQIDSYVENRVIDVDVNNVNEADVYVQSINSDGTVIETWDRVPNIAGNNVIYNSYARAQRKIYSVITRENDSISIKFGDGLFADVPMGLIRVWVRSSNAQSYTIKPIDMKNITWDHGYYDSYGRQQYLTIVADLEYSINNSSPAETMASIKRNAPLAYTTQDRMVTGEDYTIYPLTQSSDVLKVKAVNRVHSGFSRYTDPLDPTGTYQSIDMLADDIYIYKKNEYSIKSFSLSTQLNIKDLINIIESSLTVGGAVNLYYANYTPEGGGPTGYFARNSIVWTKVSTVSNKSTGYFKLGTDVARVGVSQSDRYLKQINPGALIEFMPPSSSSSSSQWTSVSAVSMSGLGLENSTNQSSGLKANGEGAVTLSKDIPTGSTIIQVIPVLKKRFSLVEINAIADQLTLKNSFGIRYEHTTQSYRIVTSDDLDTADFFSLSNSGSLTKTNLDSSWVYSITPKDGNYIVKQKWLTYIIGSENKIKFGNINFLQNATDSIKFNRSDLIKFLKINTIGNTSQILGQPVTFGISGYLTSDDGFTDSSKVITRVADADSDFLPDNPYAFEALVGNSQIVVSETSFGSIPVTTISTNLATVTSGGVVAYGKSGLIAQWQHVADSNQRIDPAMINIIDLFILSSNYDTEFRRWIKNDGSAVTRPLPMTTVALSQQFSDLELVKTSSDTIIFRPAKYKLLFGALSDTELQAKFKVIKMQGTSLTDNEIKTKLVSAVDDFFDITNWSFGETFYFTELAAYIHTRMAGSISSVVIVPSTGSGTFGNLFQVTANADELFASCASVADVEIINQITKTNIRIG